MHTFLHNNAWCMTVGLFVCWGHLKRVIDHSADARGSNRKAKQKSNPHLVAMHCGKNQWQSDRARRSVNAGFSGEDQEVRVCVFVGVGHYEGRFFCVCETVNSADNSIEEVREQTPKAASGYCFCKLKRPSLFTFSVSNIFSIKHRCRLALERWR